MKRLFRKNQIIITSLAIMIVIAGYLNFTADQTKPVKQEAAAETAEKIREEKQIRIIGDYDIDGIMSSYILLTGLRKLGAKADIRIPDRIADGYGLNENLVRQAKEDGADTILTCDNGIAALDQIRLAKELGMTVVVTDIMRSL